MSDYGTAAGLHISRRNAVAICAQYRLEDPSWPLLNKVQTDKIDYNPDITLREIFRWLDTVLDRWNTPLHSLGISCFGPFERVLDFHSEQRALGRIVSWQDALSAGGQSLSELEREEVKRHRYHPNIDRPKPTILTDANAVALGEFVLRASSGTYPFPSQDEPQTLRSAAYNQRVIAALIFDDGVGGGVAYSGGNVWQHHYHSEIGHIPTYRFQESPLLNICSAHDSCLEGFASLRRLSLLSQNPQSNHIVLFCKYISHLIEVATYSFSPDMIVIHSPALDRFPGLMKLINHTVDENFRSERISPDRHYVQQEILQDMGRFIGKSDTRSGAAGSLFAAINGTKRER